jgi:polar amino acid transport system substrate-binding protein
MNRSSIANLAIGAALLCCVAGGASAQSFGTCEMTGQKGSFHITPAVPGQLTVEVSLPAPGWWNGDTPETIKDGYEYCMSAIIAYRAGLDKLQVVNVSWAQLIGGNTKNFDLALSEASITEPRKKVVDFSTPYFNSDIALLVKKDLKLDSASAHTLRIRALPALTSSAMC